MSDATPKQLSVQLVAAFIAVGAVASFWVDARTGAMAGLLAAGFMLVPLLLAGVVPEEQMAKVRFGLRPLGIAVLLVVVLSFPYLITPSFLAPQVPLADLANDTGSFAYRRLRLVGTVESSEPVPFAIGDDMIMKLRLRDGAHQIDVLYAVQDGEPLPAEGARIQLRGVVEPYGSSQPRFVARALHTLTSP